MFPWLSVLCAVLTILCLLMVALYCNSLEEKRHNSAALEKTAASLCFCILGLIAVLRNPTSHTNVLIFVGLIFGMIGDVLLVFRYRYDKKDPRYFRWFASGTVAFLIGHLFYILAVFLMPEKSWLAIAVYTVIGFALTWRYTSRHHVDFGKRILGGIIYLAFVVFMGACTFGAAMGGNSFPLWLFALGGLCFVFSDNMLVVNGFGAEYSLRRSNALHYLYWAAQLLIAFSILL